MKIAIDATALGSGRGGDETYLLGLIHALEVVRAPVDSFPLYVNQEVDPRTLPAEEAFPRRRLRSRSRAARYLWELPRRVAEEEPKADLIIGTNHAPIVSATPRALIVHDLSFHHHPEFYPAGTRLRLAALIPIHLRQARVVLTGTEYSRTDLLRTYGLRAELVHVVPPVVEERAAVPGAAGQRAALGIAGDYFLYVGNLHPRKNLHRLVVAFGKAREASAAVRRSQLVIAGARWWGDDTLQATIAKLPHDSVLHVGRVTDDQRDALLRGTLALAYPSLFEGIGLPPLEAMSVGAPVLAARASSLPEVLGNAALMVDPLDVDDIARGLQRLAEDPGFRDRLRDLGRLRVQRYSAAEAGERALVAFGQALRKHKTAR